MPFLQLHAAYFQITVFLMRKLISDSNTRLYKRINYVEVYMFLLMVHDSGCGCYYGYCYLLLVVLVMRCKAERAPIRLSTP